MVQNADFKPIVLSNITLQYPRLKETYRYNAVEKKSEPCQPTVTNAAWSVSFEMPNAAAKKLYEELQAHYEECRKGNKKLPEFAKVFGMKKNDNGTFSFTAKKKGTGSSGQVNKPPTVIDHRKQPMADLDFWTGTTANMRLLAFPATDPDGLGGISLLLDVVQVLNPLYGGSSLDDFDVVEQPIQGSSSDLEGFGEEPPARAAPPATGSKAVPPPAKKAAPTASMDFG